MSVPAPIPAPPPASASRRGWLKTLGSLLTGGWLLSHSRTAAAGPTQVQGPNSLVGEIVLVAFSNPPTNWLPCDGRLLAITQYPALFSLLGIQFGGDGRTTFGLPNLQSRVPIGMGQGTGLQSYALGSAGGEQQHTLTLAELPAHTHPVPASTALGTTDMATTVGASNYLADSGSGVPQYATAATTQLATTPSNTGFGAPHENRQPFQALNFIICINGNYPSRN